MILPIRPLLTNFFSRFFIVPIFKTMALLLLTVVSVLILSVNT